MARTQLVAYLANKSSLKLFSTLKGSKFQKSGTNFFIPRRCRLSQCSKFVWKSLGYYGGKRGPLLVSLPPPHIWRFIMCDIFFPILLCYYFVPKAFSVSFHIMLPTYFFLSCFLLFMAFLFSFLFFFLDVLFFFLDRAYLKVERAVYWTAMYPPPRVNSLSVFATLFRPSLPLLPSVTEPQPGILSSHL